VKKIKVTLYIRHHNPQKYEKAGNKVYPHGTIFVLRYARQVGDTEKWTSYEEGIVAAMQRRSNS
jgi:hypothetical protein